MFSFLRHAPAALVCAVAVVAACSKGDKAAVSASLADSRAVVAVDPSAKSPAVPELTDANIVAILDAANVADSAAGSSAAMKGTSAEVKAFGREMMRDHHSTAQTAVGATQNAELKAMIQQAAPSIQAHLDRANKIRTTLTGG